MKASLWPVEHKQHIVITQSNCLSFWTTCDNFKVDLAIDNMTNNNDYKTSA